MNVKRYFMASVAVYVAFEIMDGIIHGGILKSTYQSLAGVWRPDMMSKMWVIYFGTLILSFLFTFIFIKGYENRGWSEGARFGLLIGLYTGIPYGFFSYAMYPIPLSLALAWFISGVGESILAGLVAAAVYKNKNP